VVDGVEASLAEGAAFKNCHFTSAVLGRRRSLVFSEASRQEFLRNSPKHRSTDDDDLQYRISRADLTSESPIPIPRQIPTFKNESRRWWRWAQSPSSSDQLHLQAVTATLNGADLVI